VVGLALIEELRNTYVVKKNEPDKTRDQVARTILEGGPASAVDLAEKLSITPAGIRRHLDSLISEGVLTARDPYQASALRGRGRPSKVFVMTDSGREKFEHSYDDLAVAALKFMASKNGSHLVNEFARNTFNFGSELNDTYLNNNENLCASIASNCSYTIQVIDQLLAIDKQHQLSLKQENLLANLVKQSNATIKSNTIGHINSTIIVTLK
jgi:predicted ArsR family transcriptional regulator